MEITQDAADLFGRSDWDPEQTPTDEHLLEMYKLMVDSAGIGLAAPQIRIVSASWTPTVKNRYFVLHEAIYPDRYVVNPKIVNVDGAAWGIESCLSFPGRDFLVSRPTQVWFTVEGYREITQSVGGYPEAKAGAASYLAARAFIHEWDHLNGKLLTDHQEI